jgi:hypothetical protein
MSDDLNIDFNWLGRSAGSPLERAFYADIGISVGDDWLTLLEDQEASTVRTHLRGCAYHLATWFAANWWRLRWEPETRDWTKNADWRIAHSMASAGGGYVWPNILFASDGNSLAIASHPRLRPAPFEPIRYLNRIDARISAAEFERKVDSFIANVLSRLDAMGVEDNTLPALWDEVREERHGPEAYQRRKFEAMAGYDPDDAPDDLLIALLYDKANLGQAALEEIAAEARHHTIDVLDPILRFARSTTAPSRGGFRGRLPELQAKPQPVAGDPPWKKAAKLAQFTRAQWGLGNNPINDETLADLLEMTPAAFSDRDKSPTAMPLALRAETNDGVDIYFNSSWSTSRRFATGRMIGDHLHFADHGRLIPATDAKTSRQQFQRAFAQEFLCPFDALLEKIQTEQPKEDDIAEAAAYFEVSPLMVRTTLVNKGGLDREVLTEAA